MQCDRVRGRGGQVDDAAGAGPERPPEHRGVEFQVHRESERGPVDQCPAADYRRAVHHQVKPVPAGGEEVPGVVPFGDVDSGDIPAAVFQRLPEMPPGEPGRSGDQRLHVLTPAHCGEPPRERRVPVDLIPAGLALRVVAALGEQRVDMHAPFLDPPGEAFGISERHVEASRGCQAPPRLSPRPASTRPAPRRCAATATHARRGPTPCPGMLAARGAGSRSRGRRSRGTAHRTSRPC